MLCSCKLPQMRVEILDVRCVSSVSETGLETLVFPVFLVRYTSHIIYSNHTKVMNLSYLYTCLYHTAVRMHKSIAKIR